MKKKRLLVMAILFALLGVLGVKAQVVVTEKLHIDPKIKM
jgi:hypothetical protein